MEIPLRSSLMAWLAADPSLSTQLNTIAEEVPLRAALPWLGLATSASVDWSTKTESGAEIRMALELHWRGDQAASGAELVAALQARVASLPRDQAGFRVVSLQFLRSRAEQRSQNSRAMLLEYRFRTIAL